MQRVQLAVVVLIILLAAAVIFNIEQWQEVRSCQQREAAESGTASPLSDSLRRQSQEPELAIAIPRFLSLPFPSTVKHTISQGWELTAAEKERSLSDKNWGVDFQLPSGTVILAPADGLALASYHEYSWCNRGKIERGGLGTFVQIFHPEAGLYTQCAYLARLEPKAQIPYLQPEEHGAGKGLPASWYPALLVIYLPPDFELDRYGIRAGYDQSPREVKPVEVKRGQVIGYVADGEVFRPGSRQKKASLHFEVFTRDPVNCHKAIRLDPYGLYTEAECYDKGSSGYASNQEHNLWLTVEGEPLHADEAPPQ